MANESCSQWKRTHRITLKLVVGGEVDGTMGEALEDYVKRQKRRLGIQGPIQNGIAKARSDQANDE
jgi:hypothetical protein